MAAEGQRVRLRFKHVYGGLVAKGGLALRGFEIAGENHKYLPAQGRIDGEKLLVWNEKVAHPLGVRYAWAMNPSCNLYNKAGLPASPFRADNGQD